MGDQVPPSSGPGWGTLGTCASLQLRAQALTAPLLPGHRDHLLGGAPFFQGPGLLLGPHPRLCWCGRLPTAVSAPLLGTRLGFPPPSQPCLATAPCLLPLPIGESGSAGWRGGPAGQRQCWGGVQHSVIHSASLLQPGGAETRTCPRTQGCGTLRLRDCPRKHAQQTFLGRHVLSAPLHCLPQRPSPRKQTRYS